MRNTQAIASTRPAGAVRPHVRALVCCLLAVLMAFAGLTCAIPARDAWAVTEDIEAEISEEQAAVEQTAAAYNDAVARVAELDAQIADNEARIAELEDELPTQRASSAEAVRDLYKLQQNGGSMISALLAAQSIGEFLSQLDSLTRIFGHYSDEAAELAAMLEELEQTRASLDEARVEAVEQQEAAEQALAEAQAARERAQQEAIARAEAERAAAEEAARQAEQQQQQDQQQSVDSGTALAPPTNDGADWSTDKTAFVQQWAPRIDAYLAGSPLAGQGTAFASAAWDYGVDPRWSPAISTVESSKGAVCFRPYNAWGWGSSSWSSWPEAINAHVAGLARGYGYTLTIEAAQKYCPPNWEHWYSRVGAEMNLI